MKAFNQENIKEVVFFLEQGQTIVFPTETSYGLGCDSTNQDAVDKIFKIKERQRGKPLLIVVPTVEMAKKYLQWNVLIEKLSDKYWPGSLTIVGKSNRSLSNGVISQNGTVAIRVTNHSVPKYLSEQLDRPIVATSANISDEGDIYNFSDIIESFKNKKEQPDMVLDYGNLPKKRPTTIISVENNKFEILRQGELEIKL